RRSTARPSQFPATAVASSRRSTTRSKRVRRRPRGRVKAEREDVVEGNRVGLARALGLFLGVLAAGSALAPNLFAQAWVPPKGEGAFGLGYQNFYSRNHYLNDSTTPLLGRIRT